MSINIKTIVTCLQCQYTLKLKLIQIQNEKSEKKFTGVLSDENSFANNDESNLLLITENQINFLVNFDYNNIDIKKTNDYLEICKLQRKFLKNIKDIPGFEQKNLDGNLALELMEITLQTQNNLTPPVRNVPTGNKVKQKPFTEYSIFEIHQALTKNFSGIVSALEVARNSSFPLNKIHPYIKKVTGITSTELQDLSEENASKYFGERYYMPLNDLIGKTETKPETKRKNNCGEMKKDSPTPKRYKFFSSNNPIPYTSSPVMSVSKLAPIYDYVFYDTESYKFKGMKNVDELNKFDERALEQFTIYFTFTGNKFSYMTLSPEVKILIGSFDINSTFLSVEFIKNELCALEFNLYKKNILQHLFKIHPESHLSEGIFLKKEIGQLSLIGTQSESALCATFF